MINFNPQYIHTVTAYITLSPEQYEIMQDTLSQSYYDQTSGESFGAEQMYTLDDGETLAFTCDNEEQAESIMIAIQEWLEECNA